ncbi:Zinc finger protein bud20 [Gracilariopsis chorda]|uniref:Zinc finger protein bud20 n=1 Tax=Gracilariopsis chorda TaxID=448386 RepID=A0A2V3IRG9_9FLOR|nr:Zinc finger protein bud20 [Gracilariopsis chorda]|eukprot:PXF44693.1 Zinc finger protein bud20 [Gracilariopsis chorda]
MGSGTGRVTKRKGSNKRSRRKRTLSRALDQIHEDISGKGQFSKNGTTDLPVDFDLPGLGQFYCVECARYFITDGVLAAHKKTKKHKFRLKELKDKPYCQAEAEAAAGMAPPDNGSTSAR